MQVEGVRKHNAAEWLIGAVAAGTPAIRLLNVHGCDVVCEQDQFVGVQFAPDTCSAMSAVAN